MPNRVAGDYGQPLTIAVKGVDPTTATTVAIVIRRPDTTKVTWIPLVFTSSISYTFIASDLSQSGVYAGEVVFTFSSPPGQTTSSIFSFTVDPGLI